MARRSSSAGHLWAPVFRHPSEPRPVPAASTREGECGHWEGGCLTTSLQAVLGVGEPGVELSRQLVDSWINLGVVSRDASFSLKGPVNWKGVQGPIAAIQATLFQAGWNPKEPDFWEWPAAAQDAWRFPREGDPDFELV
eukprot:2256102-Pyramimonas_sp.AAC.1